MIYSILVAIDVLLAIGIIGLILIQQGKGADVGAAFGSGASGTVFGARGSASFLTSTTAILVALFFVNSLVLAYLASHRPVIESVIDAVQEVETIPSAESAIGDGISDLPIEESDISDIPDDGSVSFNKNDTDEAGVQSTTNDETANVTPEDIPE